MPKKAAPKKPKTEGQRQLVALDCTDAVIAQKVGCSRGLAGHWRRGVRVPSDAMRHKLELLFGIPKLSWDVAPGAELPASASPAPEFELSGDDDVLAITKQQLLEVRVALQVKDLAPPAASKLRDTSAKLLALRSRLELARELQEDRIVREHPEWQRVKAAILKALEPYPEAAAAVAEVLA